MGKIRPDYIKDTGEKIMEQYSSIITTDFDINKEILKDITNISSKTLRNRLAGYLVVLKKNEHRIISSPKKGRKMRNKNDRVKKQNRKWV